MSNTLDYDQLILLDAENLAEAGIREAYESLLPELRKYVPRPAEVEEVIDNDGGRYAVKSGTREFVIYAPELHDEGGESWGRATVAFFTIVNDQPANSQHRFYAINGGNVFRTASPLLQRPSRKQAGWPMSRRSSLLGMAPRPV